MVVVGRWETCFFEGKEIREKGFGIWERFGGLWDVCRLVICGDDGEGGSPLSYPTDHRRMVRVHGDNVSFADSGSAWFYRNVGDGKVIIGTMRKDGRGY